MVVNDPNFKNDPLSLLKRRTFFKNVRFVFRFSSSFFKRNDRFQNENDPSLHAGHRRSDHGEIYSTYPSPHEYSQKLINISFNFNQPINFT